MVFPVIQRPDYVVHMERTRFGMTLLHCSVRRWSSRVCRALHHDINTLQDLHGEAFYALIPPENPRLVKFITPFGFKLAGEVTNRNGVAVPMYVRPPNELREPVRRREADPDDHE